MFTCARQISLFLNTSERAGQSASESVWHLEPEPAELSIVPRSGRATERGPATAVLLDPPLPLSPTPLFLSGVTVCGGRVFSSPGVCVDVQWRRCAREKMNGRIVK